MIPGKLQYFFLGTLCRQLVTGVVLVHAVMMSLFIWDLVERQQTMLLEQQTRLATSLAESVAASSAVWLVSRDLAGLQEIIEAQRRYPELEFAMVLDKHGEVLAHNERMRRGQHVRDLPSQPELKILHHTASLVDVISPVTLNQYPIGWVRIGIGQMQSGAQLNRITRNGMLYALAAIVMGALLATLMARRLTRRLHAIQTVADAVEAGNILPRVRTDGTDEAAQLGRQFNSMLDTLAAREEELLRNELAWQTAMDKFKDAIYILDTRRHLLRANAAFYAMVQGEPATLLGRHIADIIHPQGESVPCPVCRAQNELRDAVIIMETNHPDNPSGGPIEITVKLLREPNGEAHGIFMSLHDLTHDRQLQAQLAESEQRFRSIIEASPVPMALNDDALNVTYLNPAFIRRFGYTRDDIPTLNDWWPKAYPDPVYRQQVADEWLARLERSHQTQTAFTPMEATIRTQDGSICTVLASATPLGAAFAGTHIAILYDITERKQMETAMRASEQRFHAIADYTVDWENWVSPDGKLLWVNSSVERLTGYTPAECMTMSGFPLPLIAEEDREGVRQSFTTALHSTRDHHEFRILRKDGRKIWASVSWQPIYDADGQCLGHRSSVHDISALKQAEDNIRQLNAELEQRIRDRTADLQAATSRLAQFKTTLDQTLDCVFMFDPETLRFVYVNRGAMQQVGYSEAELLQMTPLDIKPGFDAARFRREILHHVLEKPGELFRFEALHRHRAGHDIPVEVSLQLIKHGDGSSRCIAIVRDISERRKTEELIHKRSLDLEAANRELEAFAYSVSHDLRAPLRAIDGFSRIMVEDYADKLDASGQGYLNRVRNAVQRMGVLIDDLLELSRVGRFELHPSRLDLSRLAGEVMEQLQNQDAGREVNIRITPNLLGTGDEMLVRLVLQNLLGNAWKFTRNTTNPSIEFGARQENGQSVYFVRDNGAGFDMQFADKLFGVFQRLHKAEEFAGSGVGLATVQRIIHRHGGQVWAEAEPGKGACFYFTLPPSKEIIEL